MGIFDRLFRKGKDKSPIATELESSKSQVAAGSVEESNTLVFKTKCLNCGYAMETVKGWLLLQTGFMSCPKCKEKHQYSIVEGSMSLHRITVPVEYTGQRKQTISPVREESMTERPKNSKPEERLEREMDLIKAIDEGDFQKIRALLESGADTNAKDENGVTALMHATHKGYVDVVKQLLTYGADVNAKTPPSGFGLSDQTALMLAAVVGHTDVLKELLVHGTDVNAKDSMGMTALASACKFNDNFASREDYIEAVKQLIAHGADVNARDNEGDPVLFWPTKQGDKEIIDLMLQYEGEERLTTITSRPTAKQTTLEQVTDSRLWKCPECGELLEKGGLGTIFMPSDPITKVAGTATCSKCGAQFLQSDIYGGRFDVKTPVSSLKSAEEPKSVSIVVFRIRSHQPPSDAKSYCRKVLSNKFPNSDMESYYIVGFADDLSTGEAFSLYQNYVQKGQLPDLGRQIDSVEGSGPGGDTIVALFFTES